jgi:outer membrane protein
MNHPTRSMTLAFALLATLAVAGVAPADEIRIGYTNIEAVLTFMPEVRQMEQQIQTYQGQLTETLQAKQTYAQGKLEEYLMRQQLGDMSPDEEAQLTRELTALDAEIQAFAADAEAKLAFRREELLLPILERLQAAIDEVAAEGGFTYILNQSNSAGVSTLLHGPDEDDITAALLAKLGIQAG